MILVQIMYPHNPPLDQTRGRFLISPPSYFLATYPIVAQYRGTTIQMTVEMEQCTETSADLLAVDMKENRPKCSHKFNPLSWVVLYSHLLPTTTWTILIGNIRVAQELIPLMTGILLTSVEVVHHHCHQMFTLRNYLPPLK